MPICAPRPVRYTDLRRKYQFVIHLWLVSLPYAASKIGADQAAYSFFASFELPVVIARPFNTYGPRQSARAIIPTIMSQILVGAPPFGLEKLQRREISIMWMIL